MQEQPENKGALRMMRDFRNLHFLVSDNPHSLMTYGHTSESLNHVLNLDKKKISSLPIASIVAAAREGHGPDEMAGQIIQISPQSPQFD